MEPGALPLRLASVPCLWGLLGLLQSHGAPPPVVWLAVFLASGLGLVIVLLAADGTGWTSLLAAVLLAASPAMQRYWVMPRGMSASDALTFLKMNLILAGLLALARMEAGCADDEPADAYEPD